MNIKKLLDAVNSAQARVQLIAAQIDGLLDEDKLTEAKALRGDLDKARGDYDEANQLYLAVVSVNNSAGDPARGLMPSGTLQVTRDEADQPFASNGEFLMAVKNAGLYPGREDSRLRPLKFRDATGASEGIPADGGYLLTPQVNTTLIERMYSTGSILSRITIDPIGPNANSALYNGIDETSRATGSRNGGVRGYWVAEAGTITGSKPKFRQFEVKPKKVAALCYATDEQLQDSTNLESWLTRVVPSELRFMAEDAIYEGDGVGKPLGIMNSDCLIAIARESSGLITFKDIITMWSRRWAGVRDYVWLINQDAMPQIDSLMLVSGSAAIPPRFVDYDAQGVLRMKGAPVLEVEYAATVGDPGDIMLASLSQYQAAEKGGVQSASSIHVQFVTDETAFRFTYRIDGQPTWGDDLTPLHGSNTVSPFVVCSSAS
jgi:HK97 family phage major capsid protein